MTFEDLPHEDMGVYEHNAIVGFLEAMAAEILVIAVLAVVVYLILEVWRMYA